MQDFLLLITYLSPFFFPKCLLLFIRCFSREDTSEIQTYLNTVNSSISSYVMMFLQAILDP
ncbi:uncharacterized protein F4812DRAFT_426504 [Daldinia caldariorum]|uniref:uncharacterized protein n=1 Tax=Daldinia caldariorum TaxID=326644 RepID=UPI002008913E|nr:uncharacterized protein F4812DRAFT_426504 [Daldinia caldariorum]KAI1468381.1 hypothetical protein F4812DRAFT_426504 [Daldinia caldariorum]